MQGWAGRLWGWLNATGTNRVDIESLSEGWQGLSSRMVDRLTASEKRFRAVIESAPTAMVMIDSDGCIVLVNAETEKVFGYAREEILGEPVEMLFPGRFRPDRSPSRTDFFSNARARRMGAGRDFFGLRKDGTEFPVEIGLNPIQTDEGEFVLSAVVDITERMQSEKESAQLSAIVESSDDAIIGKTPQGVVTSWNRGAEKLYGYTPAEMVGQSVTRLAPADRLDEIEQILGLLRRGKSVNHFETVLVAKNGAHLDISLTISPIKNANGEVVGSSTIARDVSQRKALEASLRTLNAELERRVERRTAELARLNESLEQSNQELQQFAYVASHDLKTPLRAISGFAQCLREDYQDKLDEQADEYVERIVEGVNRMQQLINDLLEFSRVEARGRSFGQTDLGEVLDDAKSLLQAEIESTGAEVVGGELPTVIADRGQMTQLFQNLIGNALKYHGEAPPQIHVSAERQADCWTIAVRDNGIGIAPEHYERIFEIFRRLHTQREYAGTGIGLAVCRRIVQRHGGRIWLESTRGEGSTFYFTLEVAECGNGAD